MSSQSLPHDQKETRRRFVDDFLPLILNGLAFFTLAIHWGVMHGGEIFGSAR